MSKQRHFTQTKSDPIYCQETFKIWRIYFRKNSNKEGRRDARKEDKVNVNKRVNLNTTVQNNNINTYINTVEGGGPQTADNSIIYNAGE